MNRIFHARIAVGQYLFLVLATIIVIYAMWMQHAVMAILFMPNYPTVVAAINFDTTGTTRIGED